MTTLNMTPAAAITALVLLMLFCMALGAALALDWVSRRAPGPAPERVQLAAAGPMSRCGCCGCQKWLCACACCCGRTRDTRPFPEAAFYMSEWLAELDGPHAAAEQSVQWLIAAGELALPPRSNR